MHICNIKIKILAKNSFALSQGWGDIFRLVLVFILKDMILEVGKLIFLVSVDV